MGDDELYDIYTNIIDWSGPVDNATVIVDWQVSGRSGDTGRVHFKAPKGRDFLMIIYKTQYAPYIMKVRAEDHGNVLYNITLTSLGKIEFNVADGLQYYGFNLTMKIAP